MRPLATARPTTVDRNDFVTLNVMSARWVSPHSAATRPRRMITPFAPARGWVGPTSVLYGASLRNVLTMSTARSFVFGFSFAIANATASSSFALSKPSAPGSPLSHCPFGGK